MNEPRKKVLMRNEINEFFFLGGGIRANNEGKRKGKGGNRLSI